MFNGLKWVEIDLSWFCLFIYFGALIYLRYTTFRYSFPMLLDLSSQQMTPQDICMSLDISRAKPISKCQSYASRAKDHSSLTKMQLTPTEQFLLVTFFSRDIFY